MATYSTEAYQLIGLTRRIILREGRSFIINKKQKMKEAFEYYLIEAVKKQPVLYDRNTEGYNNKECIETAWIEVYKEVRKNFININVTQCKLRWRTLRDRFVKQIAKTPDGTEHFTPGAINWEYTNQLSFLTKHLTKRKCEETFLPTTTTIKKHSQANVIKKRKISNTNTSDNANNTNIRPHSFSFVETKPVNVTPDNSSSRSRFLSESETQESEPEPEIEMPQLLSASKHQKFEASEFPTDSFELEETEHIAIDTSDFKVHLNEDHLNKLLITTNELLLQQIRQNSRKSPNEAYFKVLDGYFAKLPPNELDRVKVEILNLILTKRRSLAKTY